MRSASTFASITASRKELNQERPEITVSDPSVKFDLKYVKEVAFSGYLCNRFVFPNPEQMLINLSEDLLKTLRFII